MTIDEAIAIMEDPTKHTMTCSQAELTSWLRELKEAKRLLKAAVEDINFYVDCYEAHCDDCCCSQDNHCHWKHEAEALKLIGGSENGT